MDSAEHLTHVAAAVAGIADSAAGNLDAPVEHCPDYDVAQLLAHTGGFAGFVGHLIRDRADWEPSGAWRRRTGEEVGPDPIAWHRRNGDALVDAMRDGEPGRMTTTWAGPRPFSFWYRRAAQELAVHHWDAAHAIGVDVALDPALAVDGIDEYLFEFAPVFASAFNGTGETFAFVTEESGDEFSLRVSGAEATPGRSAHGVDVCVTGRAADVLLYLWGRRRPSALTVTGRAELLDDWQARVRI